MPFIGKPRQPNPAQEQAERSSAYVSEVYVNRRKVGEFRGATEEEALSQARASKAKYSKPGAHVEVRSREAPRSGQ